MTFSEYIEKLRGKKIAVIGIGVSNTPLIRKLLASGCRVTACDKSEEAYLGKTAAELRGLGAELRLGPGYLDRLDADVISGHRLPAGCKAASRAAGKRQRLTWRWRCSSASAPAL